MVKIRKTRGLTYLWVLVSVAFILSGLALAARVQSTETRIMQEKELIFIGRQFREAIRTYYESDLGSERRHQYPAKLEDLLEDRRSGVLRRHLKKVFSDPMTGNPDWGLVMVGGRIVGVHSLSAWQPIKQEGFDETEASFRGAGQYTQWVFAHPSSTAMQKGRE